MAAGVTPDILVACPRVMGLILESFSLISLERPGVVSYLISSGICTRSMLRNRSTNSSCFLM